MNWYSEFDDRMEQDAPLGRKTWFRLGGRARYMFHPKRFQEVAAITARARDAEVPVRVIGSGANVLIRDDGFDGVVVRLDEPEFRKVSWDGNRAQVGAGVDLMPFSRQCCALGKSGLEGLAGIPASVGGAVRMNAGGKFGEISNVVRRVRMLDRDGNLKTRSRDEVGFGYRSSGVGDQTVVEVEMEFDEGDPDSLLRRYDECFAYKQLTQPLADRSAGCIFKNPDGQSAGALIDQSGLKGTKIGKAYVSQRHANFIIAEDGATSSDVLHLIDVIRDRVSKSFSKELELEIEIW